jgi:2C-methyl-D-erythritol 2,4-cyclodiphosphate synthase
VVLGVAESAVSIKATTNEGVGAEGRREAISARAVALIETAP